jgi:hypothetical protein
MKFLQEGIEQLKKNPTPNPFVCGDNFLFKTSYDSVFEYYEKSNYNDKIF